MNQESIAMICQSHTYIIALGSNTCAQKNLELARHVLNNLEVQAGRTEEDKKQEIIKLDIDILMVDTTVLKPLDWERPYIQQGFKYLRKNIIEKSHQTSC